MEMAVAASRSPAGALAAGRHGLGMLSIGGTSPEAITHHSKNWSLYEEQARASGLIPDRQKWRMVTLFHIAETREKARQNVQHGIHAFRDYFSDVATFPIVPADVDDPYTFFVETWLRLHRHTG